MPFSIFGHLHAVPEDDGVLADQVDAADVAVEVDADERPIEASGDLLDVGGLAGAVAALDDQTSIVGEGRQNRHRRARIKAIGRVDGRHMKCAAREGGSDRVGVDHERFADADLASGRSGSSSMPKSELMAEPPDAEMTIMPFSTCTGTGSSQHCSAAPLTP